MAFEGLGAKGSGFECLRVWVSFRKGLWLLLESRILLQDCYQSHAVSSNGIGFRVLGFEFCVLGSKRLCGGSSSTTVAEAV